MRINEVYIDSTQPLDKVIADPQAFGNTIKLEQVNPLIKVEVYSLWSVLMNLVELDEAIEEAGIELHYV